MSTWIDPILKKLLLDSTPLIDVRAPVEFLEGSIPHSINLPIMNDRERALVGTCYKEHGQAAAIKLGHELVQGQVKEERVKAWTDYLTANPTAQIFCFRGGLRSQTSCQWIREAGIERQPIEGGYKRIRRFLLSQIEEAPLPTLFRLGGCTGSGKTTVLKLMKNAIDLEKLASHRGSAFGDNGIQPSQVRFENELALELMKSDGFSVVEDESAVIGKLTIPKRFFQQMREAPLIVLKSNEETRIKNIFEEYVAPSNFDHLNQSLERIARRLGGVRFKEVSDELKLAFEKPITVEAHAGWISALLRYYYDPFYERDLKRQQGQIVFEGSANEILEFINSSLASRKR
jgi:tRNA 2-selenouridine synthase